MLVHSRQRGQLQRVGDFLKARRIAVLIDEAHQVVQDLFLPFRKCHRKSPQRVCLSVSDCRRTKSESQWYRGTAGRYGVRLVFAARVRRKRTRPSGFRGIPGGDLADWAGEAGSLNRDSPLSELARSGFVRGAHSGNTDACRYGPIPCGRQRITRPPDQPSNGKLSRSAEQCDRKGVND